MARLDSAGDVLLAGPAIRAVAAGSRWVTLLCGPRGREAAELLPGVDEVHTFLSPWVDHEPPDVRPQTMLELVDWIRGISVDEAIILTSEHQSPLPLALLLRMAGVGTIAGTTDDYAGSLLDIRHQVGDRVHEVERSLSLVGRLGYRLPAADDGRLRIRRHEGRHALPPKPFIVVHPGSAAPARTWAPSTWGRLVAGLHERGHRVVVTGSAAEEGLVHAVAGEPREGVTPLAGGTTLAQLADVLAGAAVVTVGNTGPAHLAAAGGTPVVSIFAPTVPAHRWKPWRVASEIFGEQQIECAGCRATTCPVAGHPCVETVALKAVMDAAERCAGMAPSMVPEPDEACA
ncbi:MAG: glycosyltransferase family 9 protein [Candidatus Dormibacteria bacterium]